MKTFKVTKMMTLITTVIMGLFLCLPVTAIAKEKTYIVGFHEKPGHLEKALIHEARGIIKRTYRLIPAMAVKVSEAGIEKIKKNKKVAYVEEDAIYRAVEPLPGDEYINSWGVFHIFADVAHASGNKGAGVKIAVLDTGIDYTHEDLVGNYKGGYDFVFNDEDPFDDNDSFSHGTHVAGIIAAKENGIGAIGVAPEAYLYAVKVLDGGGFGTKEWLIAGIEWAVFNEMDIVNMSLEGQDFQSVRDACDTAYDAGVLLVAAAGNSYGGSVQFPAAYDSVIAVTGTKADDTNATFSPISPEVELSAPGVDIYSTCSMIHDDCVEGYRLLSGTSQAAPHVTGTAALLLSSPYLEDLNLDGLIDNKDVRLALHDTANDLGDSGKDFVYGFGLVNAAAASLPNGVYTFSLARISGSPDLNAETVRLAGIPYEIMMTNNGLSKIEVEVNVFENGTFLKNLSAKYHFGDKKPQVVTFSIDATETRYDVTFTPYGQSGNSADITISAQ